MTLGSLAATGSSADGCFCACCGAKMMPYFSDNAVASQNQLNQHISESFLTVKGAALFLPRGNGSSPSSAPSVSQRRNKHTGDLQQHLQTMFTVLRPEDNIRLAVRLESAYPQCTRYMVVVSTNGRQDTEESLVLGMDFSSSDCSCTVGLVLPLWSDTLIHLDGDGGFSVSTVNRVHVFKPVSVQAMWSSLQSLHKACEVARCHNYYPGSLFLTWVSYYQSRVSSDQLCINEWNAMQDVQSHRADSPVLFTDVPTERERTERLIKTRLREIMMQKDLENVTSKEIRTELEMQMVCNLREFKEFIDNEMIVILGQMDSPTEIFDHVYLGSEWNASNLEELQNSGVRYILNVTREIDNFFPGMFEYHNIRVYDEEATNLLEYWNDTYKFISKAKKAGAKCLVHCKMGVSRSASTVIAYAMKEYGWDLERAFDYVKERRAVTKPNPSFMKQLEEYQGILLASKQRHNKLWRSHSDSDLSERHEPLCKTGRSDPHNNNAPPSLHHFLGMAVLKALGAADPRNTAPQSHISDTHSEPAIHTRSHTHSNGLCEDIPSRPATPTGDSSSLPLPGPQAATEVPEEREKTDNASLRAALTLPVAGPRRPPPPSLHIMPPSPSPEHQPEAPSLRLRRHMSSPLPTQKQYSTEPSSPLPDQKAPSVQLSGPMPDQKAHPAELTLDLSSSDPSPPTLESSDSDTLEGCSLSDPASDLASDHRVTPRAVSPLSTVTTGPSSPMGACGDNDDNNNPSHTETGNIPDGRADARGSSHLSTDSIDFFSAREKFLGLSQDGRAHSLSEQASPRTPQSCCSSGQDLTTLAVSPEEEEEEDEDDDEAEEQGKFSDPAQDGCDRASPDNNNKPSLQLHLHDNGISVRHIVTEIESISHPAAASCPLAPRPPQQLCLDDRDDDNNRGSLTPPSYPQSPSTPPSDWPVGSVRRVTKQLEQRLRQELDLPPPTTMSQRSPLPSPTTEGPPGRSPLLPSSPIPHGPPNHSSILMPTTDCCEQHTPPSSKLEVTQGEAIAVSARPKDGALSPGSDSPRETERQGGFHSSDMDILSDSPFSLPPYLGPSHATGPAPIIVCPSLDLQAHSQASPPQPLLWLDGVTALDSDTDAPARPRSGRLARSSEDLERIQETLRELQAFLYEAGGLGGASEVEGATRATPGGTMVPEVGLGLGGGRPGTEMLGQARAQGPRDPPMWRRAMEIEARIRQAGLTPPSLMKRSASLAKLDCLELSANDLTDWDLRSTVPTAAAAAAPAGHGSRSVSAPHPCSQQPCPQHSPEEASKKQRVLSQSPPTSRCPLDPDLTGGGGGGSQGGGGRPPPSPPSLLLQGEEGGEELDHAPLSHAQPQESAPLAVAMTTARQQQHPLRRLRKAADKKRSTATVLYNTM